MTSNPDTSPHPLHAELGVSDLNELSNRADGYLIWPDPLPPHEADRFDTARHEAAHIVAAWAMGAVATKARISRARLPRRSGMVRTSLCMLVEEEAFGLCTGVAWESRHIGNPARAGNDLRIARELLGWSDTANLADVLNVAHEFVKAADPLIDQVAVALYVWSNAHPDGAVRPRKLRHLNDWGKNMLPNFERGQSFKTAVRQLAEKSYTSV